MIFLFRTLHLRRWRRHPARFALCVLAMAAGTAVVLVILAVQTSIETSVDRLLRVSGNADAEVVPVSGALPADAVERVASVPGTSRVSGIVRTPVLVGGRPAVLLATEPSLAGPVAAATLQLGPGEVVLGRPLAAALAVGRDDTVAITGPDGRRRSATVVALVDGVLDQVNGGQLALSTLPAALDLGGRLDAVAVSVDDPRALAATLERGLPGARVLDLAARRAGLTAQGRAFSQQLAPIGLVGLLVGGFIVFDAMSMAVLRGRRDVVVLRALGASSRQLLTSHLVEGAATGALGAAVGLVVGRAGAVHVVSTLPGFLSSGSGVLVTFSLPGRVLLTIACGAVAVGVAAALRPALAAARADPVQGFRTEARTTRRARPLAGAGAVAIGVGLGLGLPAGSPLPAAGLPLLMGGILVVSYALAGPGARALGAAVARVPRIGLITASGVARAPHRSWATVMTLAATTALVVVVGGSAAALERTADRDFQVMAGSDLWIGSRPTDDLPLEVDLPEAWRSQLAAVKGVDAVASTTVRWASLGGRRFLLVGVQGPSSFSQYRLAPAAARRDVLAGRGAVITHQFARAFDVGRGDVVTLPTPSGPRLIRVLAVVHTFSLAEDGALVLSLDELRQAYGTATGVSTYELRGTRPAVVPRRLEPAPPVPLVIQGGADAAHTAQAAIAQVASTLRSLLVVALVVCAAAVLNASSAAVAERRTELGVLRAVGATRRDVRDLVLAQVGALAGAGVLLGSMLGLVLQVAVAHVAAATSPFPVVFVLSPAVLVVAVVATAGATMAAAAVPARRAADTDVLEVLREG